VTVRDAKILNTLEVVLEDLPKVFNAKVAAAVVYKGKIISVGVNQDKTHPVAAEYQKNEHSIFLHAEVDAIVKARKRISETDLKRSTLYVARVKMDSFQNTMFGMSRPCSGCMRCIKDHGIKKVIYTTHGDEVASYVTEEFR